MGRKSVQDLFERARHRGSEQETAIVNGDEVRKELELATRKNYTRALGLWD
jgi:hypothetical protein